MSDTSYFRVLVYFKNIEIPYDSASCIQDLFDECFTVTFSSKDSLAKTERDLEKQLNAIPLSDREDAVYSFIGVDDGAYWSNFFSQKCETPP